MQGRTYQEGGTLIGWIIKGIAGALLLALVSCSVGVIETGHVGVRTTLGEVSMGEVTPGIYFNIPVFQSTTTFVAKETAVELNDLRPKAKDNLSLKDIDVSVFYKVADEAVAELYTQYAGVHFKMNGYWYPGYGLVQALSRNAIFEATAKHDSLVLHTQRDAVAADVLTTLQNELDKATKNKIVVTRVVIRALSTDESIESSIRNAVAAQKQLEQADVQIKIATKSAEAEIAKAQGIAKANAIINHTLTKEYLQHEANLVLQKFAEKGGATTVILPAGMNAAPLISLK
jgi:regulator of protease activity HflC (stomatin/prohibitin superfamily)